MLRFCQPPKPKSRWHQLKDEIIRSNLRASDKAVFRYLLDRAQCTTKDGDYKSGDRLPRWTPDRLKIARETSICIRQVRYSVRHLERHGWITATGTARNGRTAPGKKLAYALSIGDRCDCTGCVHDPGTGATGDSERRQRETVTAATFGHRSTATNGGNAAGQNRRQDRGITEEEEEGKLGPSASEAVRWTAEQREAGHLFFEIMAANGPDPWR